MPWVEIIGFVGVAFLLLMYQLDGKRKMLNAQSASHLAFAVHFAMLDATTGAVASVVRVLRNYAFLKWPRNVFIYAFFLIVLVVAGIYTWHDWTSILPIFGTVVGTTALWQTNPKNIRLLSLLVPPFWFTYSLFNESVPGMIGYTIVFLSVLLGVWRFDFAHGPDGSKKRKHKSAASHHDASRGAS